jgi:hypothetical protein
MDSDPSRLRLTAPISIAIQDETRPVPAPRAVVWNIHGDNSSQLGHNKNTIAGRSSTGSIDSDVIPSGRP